MKAGKEVPEEARLIIGHNAIKDKMMSNDSFGVALSNDGVVVNACGTLITVTPDGAERLAADLFWLARLARRMEAGWKPTDEELKAECARRSGQ